MEFAVDRRGRLPRLMTPTNRDMDNPVWRINGMIRDHQRPNSPPDVGIPPAQAFWRRFPRRRGTPTVSATGGPTREGEVE